MAEFITGCPRCGSELQVQEEWVGMELECPSCQSKFILQGNVPQKIPVSAGVVENQRASDEKTCPFCGGVIKVHAIFCKHCKTDLNSAPGPQVQTQAESRFIFICPECNTVTELPESMKDKEYECPCCCEISIAREAVERVCPLCAEKIKIKATVCKHCRKNVPPLLPPLLEPIPSSGCVQGFGAGGVNTNTPIINNTVPMPGNSGNNVMPLPAVDNNAESKPSSIFKHSDTSSVAVSILWGLSTIAWLISIVCIFIDGIASLIFFGIGLVLSVLALVFKKDEKFELRANEVILSNCRLRDGDNLSYYVRMTNQRLILSAVEYPLLPLSIALILEVFAKPKRITFVWDWNNIKSITRENKKILGINTWHIVIDDFQERHVFTVNKKLEEFWNYRMWEQ